MSIDGYKTMLENYKTCFTTFFPQIKIKCNADYCTVNNLDIVYKDIVNLTLEDKKYFIVNVKNSMHVYLPLDGTGKFHVDHLDNSDSNV